MSKTAVHDALLEFDLDLNSDEYRKHAVHKKGPVRAAVLRKLYNLFHGTKHTAIKSMDLVRFIQATGLLETSLGATTFIEGDEDTEECSEWAAKQFEYLVKLTQCAVSPSLEEIEEASVRSSIWSYHVPQQPI